MSKEQLQYHENEPDQKIFCERVTKQTVQSPKVE